MRFETGQTPDERVAVIKAATHKGISCKYRTLICQILSDLPEITYLNETCLTNIAKMIKKGEINIKTDTKVLTTTAGCMELPNSLTWR